MNLDTLLHALITLFSALAGSAGFWAFFAKKDDKKTARDEMLLGLGHDRIVYLGRKYKSRGWITTDEYESLYDYLYVPYVRMGGNGTAKRVMEDVSKLPIKHNKDDL